MRAGKQLDCAYCGKEKLSKDEIGLCKKLIHSQVEQMMCMKCLSDYFEITEEDLEEIIEKFKQQGCSLFS